MAKTIQELRKQNLDLKIVLIILGIGCIVLAIACNHFENKLKEPIRSNQNLYESLERIQSNCGSTFITTRFVSDELFVFTSICKYGDYCKSEYIPLEECLI